MNEPLPSGSSAVWVAVNTEPTLGVASLLAIMKRASPVLAGKLLRIPSSIKNITGIPSFQSLMEGYDPLPFIRSELSMSRVAVFSKRYSTKSSLP